MSEPIGICSECGGKVYGQYSVHDNDCARAKQRAEAASLQYAPIMSGHINTPGCECIACALERGRDDS